MGLNYKKWGKGSQSVLLLHGFTGSSETWDHLQPALGEHFSCIAVDLPGHGASAAPTQLGRDGFISAVSQLEELLDALALPEVDVVGYSQGARLALALAMKSPERVRRLVLESVNPGLRRSRDRALRISEDEKWAQLLEARGMDAFVESWEALPLFSGLGRLSSAKRSQLRARRMAHAPSALAAALRSMSLGVQPNFWPSLPALTMPVLLLTGAEDHKFTEMARKVCAELPMGWHRAFEGVGHAPHLEAEEAYIEELLSFLQVPDAPSYAMEATS
jgi:2-succinyl-6-hydroxy-2,4-cyclohexadiene-1-carboxylate synthase